MFARDTERKEHQRGSHTRTIATTGAVNQDRQRVRLGDQLQNPTEAVGVQVQHTPVHLGPVERAKRHTPHDLIAWDGRTRAIAAAQRLVHRRDAMRLERAQPLRTLFRVAQVDNGANAQLHGQV